MVFYFVSVSYTQVMQATPISEQLHGCQSDNDIRNLEAAMMHLTFQNTVDNKYYKLAGFGRGQMRGESCRFEKGGRPVSVADYWTNKGARIRFPELRPVTVKAGRDTIMMPAECCKLLPGQKPKTMNERHKGDMIRASAEPAPDRLEKITSLAADPNLYGADELKKFGFEVDSKPMEAEGVVLDTPLMLDGNETEIKVNNGEWKTKKFFKPHPKKLMWMTVYIRNDQNRVDKRDFEDTFCKAFVQTGQRVRSNQKLSRFISHFLAWHDNRKSSRAGGGQRLRPVPGDGRGLQEKRQRSGRTQLCATLRRDPGRLGQARLWVYQAHQRV